MTGDELTEEERAQVVEAYGHEADAHCWQDHCEDGLWHAVAQIIAARLAPVEAERNTACRNAETLGHLIDVRTKAQEAAEAEVARLTAERDALDRANAVLIEARDFQEARAAKAEALVVRLRAALSGEEHAPGPSDNEHGHNGSCVKCLRAKVATLGGTS